MHITTVKFFSAITVWRSNYPVTIINIILIAQNYKLYKQTQHLYYKSFPEFCLQKVGLIEKSNKETKQFTDSNF